jgi:glycerol-3-phosphate dehydrogenase
VTRETYDLLVIGGGVNGAWIARDAAGRGLSVVLCEKGDLGGATSSASSKLIHGGLRYLENFAFRLVREALHERSVLRANAPHIIWPMRFVLPYAPGLRPAWMIRIGLWFYDHLADRGGLPASRRIRLLQDRLGAPLAGAMKTGFTYADCWVDDARFVVLTAVDAATYGADIRTRTRCSRVWREGGLWHGVLASASGEETVIARAVVNAAGPWVEQVGADVIGANAPARVRLIKGSHIVLPRLYDGEQAFILQNDDGRVVFVLPFEGEFSLVGTTDVPVDSLDGAFEITDAETVYLCDAVNRYFTKSCTPEDVVWSYAGVRPLYDDGEHDPSDVTRDYTLVLDAPSREAPLLSVFGGKITTARCLAEEAMERLGRFFPSMGPPWTAGAPLPGGNVPDFDAFVADLRSRYPALDGDWLFRLARRYGARAHALLYGVQSAADLGTDFGGGLYAREIDWLIAEEWACEADDVLWRRTKCGLHMTAEQRAAAADYIARMRSGTSVMIDSTPQS